MRELEVIDTDLSATDKEWEEYRNRDDVFMFYSPDCDIIYVLKIMEL